MFFRAPQGARLRSAAPVRRGTLAVRRLWTACCPSAQGRGDAGMIVMRPLSGDDRPAAGGATCRHRQVGIPDGRGGAARHDRRRGRPGDAHPAIAAVGGPPDGGLHVPTTDAAHSFARAAAVALRDRGIRCNAVCPGFTGPRTG